MVRSCVKIWDNSDIRQAKPFIDDDVVNFSRHPLPGDSHVQSGENWNCEFPAPELRVPMDGLSRHDEVGEPLPLFVPLKAVGLDVKFLRRPSVANLGVKTTNYDFAEGMVFSAELL
ncbi:hypothetical protein RB195_010151 [Necator americanus]|uniref:Uncharacterized protein n=1 Tax=Necator americanus TaxID=51031 RepID=A0ABR1CWP3_NECAM